MNNSSPYRDLYNWSRNRSLPGRASIGLHPCGWRRFAVLSWPLQRLLDQRFPEPRAVTRPRLDSLEVPAPCRVFYCPTSSALLASGAPPTSLARPRGIPRQALSQNVSPTICPLGVRCLSRVPGSASARAPLLRHAPPKGDVSFQSLAGLPLVGFLLPRTPLRRVPLVRRDPPCGRPRGTRVAKPSSVPSSGFLPLSTVPASTRRVSKSLDSAVCRGPRRFAAFFHAARVPGTSLQSFPFPGSRIRSRGPLLPCGFAFDRRQRNAHRRFTIAFAVRAELFALQTHPEADRDS